MQSIITRYHGATNKRPARIIATASGWSRSHYQLRLEMSYDYELGEDQNHQLAAMTLANRLAWPGEWHGGGLNKDSEVWVRAWYDKRASFQVGGPKP